jgi:hypothetical protein
VGGDYACFTNPNLKVAEDRFARSLRDLVWLLISMVIPPDLAQLMAAELHRLAPRRNGSSELETRQVFQSSSV